VGIYLEDGIYLTALSRWLVDDGEGDAAVERRITTADPDEIANWRFKEGDVIHALCSSAGIVFMRQHPGCFAARGLRCHQLLGGRRHERFLYECVLATGASPVDFSLEELLDVAAESRPGRRRSSLRRSSALDPTAGPRSEVPWFLKQFRGYPLAAWRRRSAGSSGIQPLCPSTDRLAPGDVILIDAFEDFPTLPQTSLHFLVASLVPKSQAPRHGRPLDWARGVFAIVALLVVVIMEDFDVMEIIVGHAFLAILLCMTQTVRASELSGILSWPLLLTVGAGEGIAVAFRRTGAVQGMNFLLVKLKIFAGLKGQLSALAVICQCLGNVTSNLAAGLIIAPLARSISIEENLNRENMSVLVIFSCNMALSLPPGKTKRDRKEFFLWVLPLHVLTAATVILWTLVCEERFPAPSSDSEGTG